VSNEKKDLGQSAAEPVRRSTEELHSDILKTRAALTSTLNSIEDRFNVPRQMRRCSTRAAERMRGIRDENPAALAAGVVAVSLAAGGLLWLGVRSLTRR
jgi:hypothetical protein